MDKVNKLILIEQLLLWISVCSWSLLIIPIALDAQSFMKSVGFLGAMPLIGLISGIVGLRYFLSNKRQKIYRFFSLRLLSVLSSIFFLLGFIVFVFMMRHQ